MELQQCLDRVYLLEARRFLRSLSLAYEDIDFAMCLSRSVVNFEVEAKEKSEPMGFRII
jgi:hypothetical protein